LRECIEIGPSKHRAPRGTNLISPLATPIPLCQKAEEVSTTIVEFFTLLSLGLIVGLSGAIIPGPLLAFTLFDTSRKKRVTGPKIILGHAAWESLIIIIILLGFGTLITKNILAIYLLGGIALTVIGINMLRNRGKEANMEKSKVNSSFIGGIFYTAFNPTQPLWWATGGLALLLTGLEMMSIVGILVVTAGHWLSDLIYYTFVSFAVKRNEAHIIPHQKAITIVLACFMMLLGAYFLVQSIQPLLL
jgi:threonine/homoserine/homoserine lactone efflux protein